MASPSLSNHLQVDDALARQLDGRDADQALRCEVIEGEGAIKRLEPIWRDLSTKVNEGSPTAEWPWLSAWWSTFGETCPKTGRRGFPYIVLVWDGDLMVAAYPFFFLRRSLLGVGLLRLRPIGYSGELEPSGLTEESMTMVLCGYESRARIAVLDHLCEASRRRRWDCIIFRQLNRTGTPFVDPEPKGVHLSTKRKSGPQIVHLPETWAAFRKQLTKSMRDNLPYYPRLLVREGHAFQICYCREPESIEAATEHLIRLHKLRVFSDVGQTHQDYFTHAWEPLMLRNAFVRLAQEQRGFIAMLEVDGSVVAAQGFLHSGREMVVHYSGFDPAFAKYSPLLVLQSDVFKQGIEQGGVERLNLLFGQAQWQTRWGAEAEGEETRTLILRKSPFSLFRAGLYAIAREVVAYYRRSGLRRLASKKLRLDPLT